MGAGGRNRDEMRVFECPLMKITGESEGNQRALRRVVCFSAGRGRVFIPTGDWCIVFREDLQ